MKKILALSTAAVFAASTAFAGSLAPTVIDPAPTIPEPVAAAWSGFYAGGLAGWAMGDTNFTGTVPSSFNGALYGGFAGYNHEFASGLVVGGEVAVSTGLLKYKISPDLRMTVLDAKLRVGFAAGKALVFASGGYSMARYGGGDEGSGWNAGLGVDYMVTDNFFVGGEYVYRDITDTKNSPATWEDKFGTIQVRVGYKF